MSHRPSYNLIAGQSVERLAALSDGIFAVAMTLLVLDLHIPTRELVHNDAELRRTLLTLTPQFIAYLMSFITLGIFWVGQQTHLNHLTRSDRGLAWIHIFFLSAVSLMPFSTRLLSEFISLRSALVAYWLNILLLGVTLYFALTWAVGSKLLKEDVSPHVVTAVKRRVVIAQSLYAFGIALCVFSTYLSIAFIVLVQLNYAIAPGWRRRGGT